MQFNDETEPLTHLCYISLGRIVPRETVVDGNSTIPSERPTVMANTLLTAQYHNTAYWGLNKFLIGLPTMDVTGDDSRIICLYAINWGACNKDCSWKGSSLNYGYFRAAATAVSVNHLDKLQHRSTT